jgi:hypothetical protein
MEKLSATEFARLTTLLTKGSALTPEEQTEKAALESKILAERADDQTPPAPTGEGEGEGQVAEDPAGDDTGEETPPADGEETVEGDVDPASAAFTGLTVGQKFRALLTSRATLSKALGDTRAALATARDTATRLAAELVTARAYLATAAADLATAKARVTTLEAEAQDVHTAVVDELAGLGVAAGDLAPVASGGAADDLPANDAALEVALGALQTADEKIALLNRYKAAQKARAGKAA